MKMSKIALLLFIFVLGLRCWGADEKIDGLTLQDAIHIAIAQNLSLKAALADVKIGEAQTTEANSGLLPNLSVSYSAIRELNPAGPTIQSSFGIFKSFPYLLNTYKDGVTLNQLIFDGAHTESLVKQAHFRTESLEAQYRGLIHQITFNVSQGFYALIEARRLVRVAEDSLKNAQVHLRLAEANYKAGIAAKADVTFAEVPVASATLDLTRAKETALTSEATLDRTLSFDVNTKLELQDPSSYDEVIPSEKDAQVFALRDREEIKSSKSQVEAARAQLGAAKGSAWPVISAFANYGYTDYMTNAIPGNLGWTVGGQITLSLFDGNLQSAQVHEGAATVEKNVALLDSAVQDVLLDVKQAYLRVTSAKQAVVEAEVEAEKAKTNVDTVSGQYKVGVVPILNLIDAETANTQAQTRVVTTELDYHTAFARLNLAMGR